MVPLLLGLLPLSGCASPCFTAEERAAVVRYWEAPGRLIVSAPDDTPKAGPFTVRLTPEGSGWFLAFQRAVSDAGKTPPNRDVAALEKPDWQTWVERRVAWDRRQAQEAADRANAACGVAPAPPTSVSIPAAGPIPDDLLQACGNPPRFAAVVAPLKATVTLDDEVFTYKSHVNVRPRFAYYRFPQGTVAYGPPVREMPEAEQDAVFAAAGLTPSEQRVCKAVSRLEGGFESVNTYDTGYVSVGFIQFITASDGRGSLASVLSRQKADRPAEFQADFRRFGIDINEEGVLCVVDPETGAELAGAEAVQRVIEDRRLAAVFQRAGRRTAFRVAQVLTAKAEYWPASIEAVYNSPDGPITYRVSDVITSEAGLATLFDRKVNRGNIRPFEDVVAQVMAERGLKTPAEVLPFERDVVARMKYRVDFLADAALGQPPAPPATPVATVEPSQPERGATEAPKH